MAEQNYHGFFKRRLCLAPTWRAWLLFTLVLVIGVIGLFSTVHPFLAVHQPVPSEILVSEGWLPDYDLEEVKREFDRGKYKLILATGLPLERGAYLCSYRTNAHVVAATMVEMGVKTAQVYAVPGRYVENDRTYATALALRDWLKIHAPSAKSVNVATRTVHARRTRLLFQQALGSDIAVGVIALPDREYDPAHWWRYSSGVKTVITEGIGYLYVKFFQEFHG